MSLGNYYHEDICFICDECDAEFQTDTKNMAIANELRKDEGWKIKRVGKRYEHKCPNC